MTDNALGEFLTTRRARLQPGDVGLASHGRRRVAGLRREEVAVLAGMNTDYYARLEQGRETRPSAQILDALASALRLDDTEHDHLYRLAGVVRVGQRGKPVQTVDGQLGRLLDGFSTAPAIVLDPALNILSANALAQALFSPFAAIGNLARMTFLDPIGSQFYREWERAAESTVASLQHAMGTDLDYEPLHAVVDELEKESPTFAEIWSRRGVREKSAAAKDLMHPEVGALTLSYNTFDVRGARGQQLVVYHAEPGSRSEQALILLGTLGATKSQAL